MAALNVPDPSSHHSKADRISNADASCDVEAPTRLVSVTISMVSRARLVCVAVWVAACGGAISVVPDGGNGDGGDASDATQCSQYDLGADPLHCGSCTHACTSDEMCTNGTCVCGTNLSSCSKGDASTCVDLSSSVDDCAQCGYVCAAADAGFLLPGTQNPDAGTPSADGGYDAGVGWLLGTRACNSGTCGFTCPAGFTECMQGICFDTLNFHGYCGSCSTSCKSTEWCTQGRCCPVGTVACGASCVDVMWDDNNCGACGVVCNSAKPACVNGACASAVSYHASFDTFIVPTTQCTDWDSFRANLKGTYSSITLSGSNDPTGRTCTGVNANTLCQALHSGTTVVNLSCGGYAWNVDTCVSGTSIEISADGTACYCSITNGYAVRPCIGNQNWGGIESTACEAPPQTISVVCE
ncbi:MAG TPA: hypothetical protein VLM85_19010 [Polyangiaceae bacterium]|nr:hypothetical protein [Polyangiaceae bacterium]